MTVYLPDRTISAFIIRPATQDLSAAAQVSAAGEIPFSITRSVAGMVELSSIDKDAVFCYTIGKEKSERIYRSYPDARRRNNHCLVKEQSGDQVDKDFQ